MNNNFNVKKLARKMTRIEFLNKVNKECWCVSKYGLNRIGCSSGDYKEEETCNDCFKRSVKKFKFKDER